MATPLPPQEEGVPGPRKRTVPIRARAPSGNGSLKVTTGGLLITAVGRKGVKNDTMALPAKSVRPLTIFQTTMPLPMRLAATTTNHQLFHNVPFQAKECNSFSAAFAVMPVRV